MRIILLHGERTIREIPEFLSAAEKENVEIIPVLIENIIWISPTEFQSGDNFFSANFDAVISRIPTHREYDTELLRVNDFLDSINIPLLNDFSSRAICMDKFLTAEFLDNNGFPHPITLPFDENFSFENTLSYPMVIKARVGHRGQEVWLAESRGDLKDILMNWKPGELLTQEYISSSRGISWRALIAGEEIISYRQENDTNWHSNISQGAEGFPEELPKVDYEMCLMLMRELNLSFAGIDLLLSANGDKSICEINAVPDYTLLRRRTDIYSADLFPRMIIKAIKKQL